MLRLICAAALVAAGPAMAESKAPKTSGAMTPADVSCADFTHNPDGSWTPGKTVRMGSIRLKAGKALVPGTMIGGMDIAAHLTKACARANPMT